MKTLSSLFLVLLLTACGSDSAGPNAKLKPKAQSLTLEESKKLTTPTVYYIPQYDQTSLACAETVDMKAKDGKLIVKVCKEIYSSCVLQGTCQIKKLEQKMLINVGSKVNGERRFTIVKTSDCKYGRGAVKDHAQSFKTMCLDPYYSVAADLSIYKLGDVIFIPSFVGMRLPNGEIHDGHFIVRDTGGSIDGYGRFDFFSGFDSPKNKMNPLNQVEFVDKNTHVPYYLVTGPKAEEILEMRNFPELPVQ